MYRSNFKPSRIRLKFIFRRTECYEVVTDVGETLMSYVICDFVSSARGYSWSDEIWS